MGINLGWFHAARNPWRGCHKVSAGCQNCYAYAELRRLGGNPDLVVRAAGRSFHAPQKWRNRCVIVCSESDFFIAEADQWRREAWSIMPPFYEEDAGGGNTFWILTKRPERIERCLPHNWNPCHSTADYDDMQMSYSVRRWSRIRLGVSVENQETADERISILREIPVAFRFVAVEPMLESVKLDLTGIDWVICGGESGPQRRTFDPAWARSVYDQCREVGVPLFYKQVSELQSGRGAHHD